MCAHLERSGFQICCGEKYGVAPGSLGFVPDAILVRSDTRRMSGQVRSEVSTLLEIRRTLPQTPLILALPGAVSAEESDLAVRAQARIVHTRPGGYIRPILAMLREVVVNPQRS
jgi:hypothetical protein